MDDDYLRKRGCLRRASASAQQHIFLPATGLPDVVVAYCSLDLHAARPLLHRIASSSREGNRGFAGKTIAAFAVP
ncbi:hypothetical protein ZHAS_00007285 [Anopheles sinensis]|uniref:Uncharacterized protein n=1 Tax=Anopheles sinensis TaxID=74873 RepID=A0A084VPL2_ANOSI|nr:hypothetical protein ZHAS_00007285 [Anopheles sinensis]